MIPWQSVLKLLVYVQATKNFKLNQLQQSLIPIIWQSVKQNCTLLSNMVAKHILSNEATHKKKLFG